MKHISEGTFDTEDGGPSIHMAKPDILTFQVQNIHFLIFQGQKVLLPKKYSVG